MKKVGAVLLSMFFVFVAFATIFAINVNQTLLKSSFYKDILEENNAYERLLKTDPKFFISFFEAPEEAEVDFNKDVLANAIGSIETKTLKKIVEAGIDAALVNFNNADSADLSIDLTEIKVNLASGGDEISVAFSETLPDSYSLFQEDTNIKKYSIISANIIIIVLVVSLIVLLGLIWLLSESWRSRFKTLGIILFVISLPILAVAVFGLYLIPINFSTYPEISELVLNIIESLRDGFLFLFLTEALVIGVVALVLYVFAIVLFKSNNKILAKNIKEKNVSASQKD